MKDSIISRNPDIVGGAAVFTGTRVPIKALFDYLETGDNLENFLDDFPTVSRAQVLGLLELAHDSLTGSDEAAA